MLCSKALNADALSRRFELFNFWHFKNIKFFFKRFKFTLQNSFYFILLTYSLSTESFKFPLFIEYLNFDDIIFLLMGDTK